MAFARISLSNDSIRQEFDDYRHVPLNAAGLEIRLFRYSKDEVTGTLEMQLQNHRLGADCPTYAALSYAWGVVKDLRLVTINGKRLMIRKNLLDFLLSILEGQAKLKSDDPTTNLEWFWADQISIDQTNVEERSKQVGIMNEIYSSATVIHAYTGDDSPDARTALDAMFPRSGAIPEEGREIESIVEEFCKRDYWYRLWIVQELHVAAYVVFWCGAYCVTSHTSSPAGILETGKFQSRKTRAGQHVVKVRQMQSPARLVSGRGKEKRSISLSRAVVSFSDQLCADLRDKVFGLQALVHFEERLPIDYSKTTEEVFDMSIKNYIQHYRRPKTFTDMRCFRTRAKHWDFDIMTLTRETLHLRAGEHADPLLQTLCWAHWLLHIPRDKALISASPPLATWMNVWTNVAEYAVTAAQKRLADELFTSFEQLLNAEHADDLGPSTTLEVDLELHIGVAAKACGFVEVDQTEFAPGFLVHPDDHPLRWREAMIDDGFPIRQGPR